MEKPSKNHPYFAILFRKVRGSVGSRFGFQEETRGSVGSRFGFDGKTFKKSPIFCHPI